MHFVGDQQREGTMSDVTFHFATESSQHWQIPFWSPYREIRTFIHVRWKISRIRVRAYIREIYDQLTAWYIDVSTKQRIVTIAAGDVGKKTP